MRLWVYALALAIFCSGSFAGFVYGEIYKNDLEKLNKTVITIEGKFSYRTVTNSTNYSIFLPGGEYRLSASYFDERGVLLFDAEEKVNIGTEDQKIDLILKPVNSFEILWIILSVVGLLFLMLLASKMWESSKTQIPNREVKAELKLDEESQTVLNRLESFEGRATQRELRNSMKFSDAKLSLVLSELEAYGLIKKFKRGRGNIIKRIE